MSGIAFRHEFPVRYAEVDMQGVVFNSHYLAYVDEAMSHWMRAARYDYGDEAFDFMVRHAEVDWQGSATYGDMVQIDCRTERWGSTSFDIGFDIKVRETTIVLIKLTYVGIDPATKTKSQIPDTFKSALSVPLAG
jgi:acyl-CoA thioester hydrolase